MASGWRATTTIKAGKAGTFQPGDLVTGLDKEQMAQLWESGALREEVPAPTPSTEGSDVSQTASGSGTATGPVSDPAGGADSETTGESQGGDTTGDAPTTGEGDKSNATVKGSQSED